MKENDRQPLFLLHPGFGMEKRADQGRLKSCGGPLKKLYNIV